MAAASYFFHVTRDEENDRYLVTIVAAALIPKAITDIDMHKVIGEEEGVTDNILDTRTNNLITNLFDAHMLNQASL